MNKTPTPPMVHMTPALWALVVLLFVSCVPFFWSLRPPKREAPKPQYHHVSWRVLWWRKLAPADVVRRELAPHEAQMGDVARINDLFPDDAQEGDHARS